MRHTFGIDVTSVPIQPAGIGQYVLHLTGHLTKTLTARGDTLFVFGRSDQRNCPAFHGARFVDCGTMHRLVRIVWEQMVLPSLTAKYKLKLLHSPNYTIPWRSSCKRLCTIHDLTCFLYPKRRKWVHGFYFRKMMAYAVRHADFVLTDSDNTRADVLRVIGGPEDRIRTVYPGVGPLFQKQETHQWQSILHKYRVKQPYFLFVSTLEPSKNVERLIGAFTRFMQEAHTGHQLVLVGKPGWGFGNILSLMQSESVQERVIHLGYMAEEDLVGLYNGADAFVYPSLYEGFGIPPLEAMACGTPVVCSNTSSLPEVVGGAALTFDPYDERRMAFAMHEVIKPGVQNQLVTEGYQRCKLFSWEKTADSVADIYHRLVAS